MSEPQLHVRLVDEFGTVHVNTVIHGGDLDLPALAMAHYGIASSLTERGIRWRLDITDPDGEIADIALEG